MAVQHGMRQANRLVLVARCIRMARVAPDKPQDAPLRVAHHHTVAATGLGHGGTGGQNGSAVKRHPRGNLVQRACRGRKKRHHAQLWHAAWVQGQQVVVAARSAQINAAALARGHGKVPDAGVKRFSGCHIGQTDFNTAKGRDERFLHGGIWVQGRCGSRDGEARSFMVGRGMLRDVGCADQRKPMGRLALRVLSSETSCLMASNTWENCSS